MAHEPSSNSSRVKVEYHDPHGVFQHIRPDLEVLLPLRNLNWNSPNRPLRLIDTLYIELETDSKTRPSSLTDLDVKDGSGRPRSQSARNQRRHQIPGLSRTPYIKILLLRCDDTDTYKASSRKEIREWIKTNTPSSTSKASKTSTQENHDAYEWMILHVVLPDSERRIVWPDRSSNKIIGYLRDDFNGSSKSGPDRVAQVPSFRASFQDDARAIATDQTVRQQAGEAWEDTLSKLKALILASFDQRVRQYEEDIREKGAQRALPGWNFNTFFVLKEGLARGFESVGLVEDALGVYDELQVELDAAIRNKMLPQSQIQDATIFRDYSLEIKKVCSGGSEKIGDSAVDLFDRKVLDADKKNYRDLILSSDISIFDFKTYVFDRQSALLQRLGTTSRPGQGQKSTYEPRFLCEMCQRTTAYMTSTTNALRDEVLSCMQTESPMTSNKASSQIVSAWVYNTCVAMLGLTQTDAGSKSEGTASRTPAARSTGSDAAEKPLPQWQGTASSTAHVKALLASRRAGLFKAARRSLEDLASYRGWLSSWSAVSRKLRLLDQTESSEEVSELHSRKSEDSQPPSSDLGLGDALRSEADFWRAVGLLNDRALESHAEAGDIRSIKVLQTDVAIYKFLRGSFVEAAYDLGRLRFDYLDATWIVPYVYISAMLCHSFRELKDTQGYVRSCLDLAAILNRSISNLDGGLLLCLPQPSELLREAIKWSENMEGVVSVNLSDFASDVHVDHFIRHNESQTGFSLKVNFGETVLQSIGFDELKVTLVVEGQETQQTCELLASKSQISSHKTSVIEACTYNVMPGNYRLQSLGLSMGKVRFVREYDTSHAVEDQMSIRSGIRTKNKADEETIRVWLAESSLDATVEVYESVDLDQPKSLVLSLLRGKSDIHNIEVRCRPGTSGLRLHTARAEAASENCTISDSSSTPGLIRLQDTTCQTNIRIKIPFQLEHDVKQISLRTEVDYFANGNPCRLTKFHRFSILLPLGVNVQDIFKASALFSRFSISSSTSVPLRIIDYNLDNIPGFQISSPVRTSTPYPVFVRQPASLVYKISKEDGLNGAAGTVVPNVKARLRLKLVYRCLDEEILAAVKDDATERLKSSDMTRFIKPIHAQIQAVMLQTLNKQDIEAVALLREVMVPSFDQLEWSQTLAAFPEEERMELLGWLRNWHEAGRAVGLSSNASSAPQRSISIPVDIPPLQILHTASLQIISEYSQATWQVGDAIPAVLRITHTTNWSASSESDPNFVEVSYELEAPHDAWVLGGEKRGVVHTKEGETRVFTVLLLPQRSGHIPFPSLDVRTRSLDKNEQVHSELDYQSSGQSIHVLPGLETPTVGITLRPERRSTLLQL